LAIRTPEEAMAKRSAGLLLYRRKGSDLEVLLVHPGGPFWARKDDGAWSIPKGLLEDDENPLAAARREFEEETGFRPDGAFAELGSFKQPSGKVILAWAVEGDFDPRNLKTNAFSMEWPPKSGRMQEFPEVDRAAWFKPAEAMRKVTKGQRRIIEALLHRLGVDRIAPDDASGSPNLSAKKRRRRDR
jgi:predicted NUDIX family NTP pyrophosphohydrolase